MKNLDFIRKRFPGRRELLLSFSFVVVVVYSWSIRSFLYQVPSYLLTVRGLEIVLVFFDLMASALLESVIVLIGILLIDLLLPMKWFKQGFLYKSALTLLVAAGAMIWFRTVLQPDQFPAWVVVYKGSAIFFVTWVGLLFLFHRVEKLQKVILFIGDRIDVLAYLYFFFGIVGWLIFIVQKLR